MRLPHRLLIAAAGAVLALLAHGLLAPPASAAEEIIRDCICGERTGACQHWLRNPRAPTEDPCWCHKCRTFSKHDGGKVPEFTNQLCFGNNNMACYLKRHSVAWGITCSECVQDTDCCKMDSSHNCPDCMQDGDNPLSRDVFGRPAKETVLAQLAKEQRHFKKTKNDVIVAYNRNFYVVSDTKPLKVKKEGGGSYRIASGHEWVHLMVERAEYARREFIDHFGSAPGITSPTAMYFPMRERDAGSIQSTYFGSPKTNLLYGGGGGGVSDGFCFNGFCNSLQKFGSDHDAHMAMRHMLGHEFISCWIVVDGKNRALPRWMFIGAAHWLCKLQERFRDDVTFCGNESTPISGSGKKWLEDCAKMARSNKYPPIEELFGKTASGQLDLKDHKRAWGYFHLALSEWRLPWAKALTELRRKVAPRDAFMKHMNCTPEVFHERWEARLKGTRQSLDPRKIEGDFEGNESPGFRERKKLRAEADPQKLAALVRGLGTITDPKTVETVIDLMSKNSELVRETIVVTLLKIKDPEVLETMWQYGLNHRKPMSRAYTARACGRHGLEFALPKLREQLEDSNWYARAEAGVAVGLLGDLQSMSKLRDMVHDSAEKTRVAAMDALAMFGEDSHMAVPLITRHLKSPQWQLRVTACQALGKIGSMEAVEPLITRMEVESGRLRRDLREALKEITRDDLGRKPEHWRNWWEKEKANTPNGLPKRPDAPKEDETKDDKPDPNARYAQQEYYGIEIFSARLGFVIDTSGSMGTNFTPDPAFVTRLARTYMGKNKITICKEEVAYALKSLDPRSHFNIIAFGTAVRTMSKNPIPASGSNVNKGIGFLRSLPANGETNYYGALRAALDLGDTVDSSSSFRSTPDTLTFLTDGMPTRGEMTDADTLLEWYTSLNRYARVRTHVIAFGNKGVDLVLLRGMAERNDGKFVHVAEKRPQ